VTAAVEASIFGCLVSVVIGLVWTLLWDTQVVGLGGGELGELDTEVVQVESGDGLVQDLWEGVDAELEWARLGEFDVLLAEVVVLGVEESDLSDDLVSERAGHDEGGVAGGTAQVDQSALGEEDDVTAVLEEVSVDLWLDVDDRLGVRLQPSTVNLVVKVTDVADDGVVWHVLEVLAGDDLLAAGGGDEDLADLAGLLHWDDLVAGDSGLEGVDWVDLGDEDTGTHAGKSHNAALTNITETSDDGGLTSNHDIGGTLDTVDKGFTAAVEVVELGLGDRVVDVDGWDLESALTHHLVQVVDTSSGLLGKTVAVLKLLWVLLVNEGGQVTTVVQDHVQLLAILEGVELLLNAPDVLLLGLTLPGEDWDAGGSNGGSGVVLSGENVAGSPGDLSTEGSESLDQNSGLNGHVETAGNSGALQRLDAGILLSGLHETWHLVLGQLNFLAAEGSKTDVGNFVVLGWGRHFLFFIWRGNCEEKKTSHREHSGTVLFIYFSTPLPASVRSHRAMNSAVQLLTPHHAAHCRVTLPLHTEPTPSIFSG
jgi:hypothetical protein